MDAWSTDMPRWILCLTHLARLHQIQEYARDRVRFSYPPQVDRHRAGSAGDAPQRQRVEVLEPRLLFSGDTFSYAVSGLDPLNSALGEQAEMASVLLDEPFQKDTLFSRKPTTDFDNLPQRSVGETGHGTILFTLDDLSGLNARGGTPLFERELYGPGSARLAVSLTDSGKENLSLTYRLIAPDGGQTELGSIAFSQQDLASRGMRGPVFAVSWSDASVRFYVDGQIAATTLGGKSVMDSGRSALTNTRATHAALQKQGDSLLGTTLSYGAVLSDDQVAALSVQVTQQMVARQTKNLDGLSTLQFQSAAMTMMATGTLITELRSGQATPTEYRVDIDVTAMSTLAIGYSDLSFYHSGGQQEFDAFELALVDAQGNAVVPTIGEGRDAFFNITDGMDGAGLQQALPAVLAEGAGHDAVVGVVGVDVSGLSGTYTLVARIVGNDIESAGAEDYSRVSVMLEGENATTYDVLWGIDEDDATLYAIWDVSDPVSTYVDFGVIHYDNGSTLVPLTSRVDAIAIDESGVAYLISNQAVDGVDGPVLLRVDTNTLDPQTDVVAQVLGQVPVPAVVQNDEGVTGLDFDAQGNLFATYRSDSVASSDRLLKLLVTDVGGSAVITIEQDFLLESRPADAIVLEAESGVITSPMAFDEDSAAGQGAFVQVAPGNNSLSSAPTSGTTTMSFTTTQSGDHYLWGRLQAPTGSADSFWVRVDGGAWTKWNNNHPQTQWGWKTVHDSDNSGAQLVYNWQAGTSHTIEIAYREEGAKLDQLLITTDSAFDPASPAHTITQAEDLSFDSAGGLVVSNGLDGKLYRVDPSSGRVLGEFDSEVFGSVEAIAFAPTDDTLLVAETGSLNARSVGEGAATNTDAFRFNFFGTTDIEALDFHTTSVEMPERQTFFLTDEDDGELGVVWNANHADTAQSSLGFLMLETSPGTFLPLAGIEPAVIDNDGVAYFVHTGAIGSYTGVKLLKLDLTQAADDVVQVVQFVGTITFSSGYSVPGLTLHPTTGELFGVLTLGDTSNDADILIKINKTNGSIISTIGLLTDSANQHATYTQAIAFNADGSELYISDIYDDDIYTVDPADASITGVYDGNPFAGFTNPSGRRINALALDTVADKLLGSDQVEQDMIQLTSGNGGNSILYDLPASLTDSEGLAMFPHRPPAGDPSGSGMSLTPPTISGPENTIAANPLDPRYSVVDPDTLSDVSTSFELVYLHSSANARSGEHFVGIQITKNAVLDVREQLVIAIDGPDFVDVDLINSTGLLPAITGVTSGGLKYIEVGHLLARDSDGFFETGSQTGELTLRFRYRGDGQADYQLRERFDYSLSLLGAINQAPAFTTDPYAGPRGSAYPVITDPAAYVSNPATGKILEIVAGQTLTYNANAIDPEQDAINYTLINGPSASITLDAGALAWTPDTSEIGTHTLHLRATDEHGLYDSANDQFIRVRVVPAIGNRAPQFVTDPVLQATAGQPYSYDAQANDPDGDTVTYGFDPDLTDADDLVGSGFQVDPTTGTVSWSATVGPINTSSAPYTGVSSKDGHVGAGYMMYSAESLHSRFAGAVFGNNTDHFISVIYENDQWYYFNNDAPQIAFTPRATDILVASIQFNGETTANPDVNTIQDLKWTEGVIHGIASGYASGNLSFRSGTFHGTDTTASDGEFDVLGTFFTPNFASIVGQSFRVHLTADDGQGGVATQPYVIQVNAPENNAPIFTKLPATTYVIPGNLPGDIDAGSTINIDLADGETFSVTGASVLIPGMNTSPPPPMVTGQAGKLVVENNRIATDLLSALVGSGTPGVVVSNPQLSDQVSEFDSNISSAGIFVNDSDTYGLGRYGIVLSTGNAAAYGTYGSYVPNNGVFPAFDQINFEGLIDRGFGSSGNETTYDIRTEPGTELQMLEWISGENLVYDDTTSFSVDIEILDGVEELYFNLAIGSEEWSNFVFQGSDVIDAFGIYLHESHLPVAEGDNIAQHPAYWPADDHPTRDQSFYEQDPNSPNYQPPGTFDVDKTINVLHPQFDQVAGTELDGVLTNLDGTPTITFSSDVTPGNYTLTFIISDTGDARLDTTVYVSSLGSIDPSSVDVDLIDPSGSGLLTVDQEPNFRTSLGTHAEFDFTLTGDGEAHAFTLDYINAETNQTYGSIPVLINVGYQSQAQAIDPDQDAVTYSFIDTSGEQTFTLHGATIHPTTGDIDWDPTVAGTYTFTIQAKDSKGARTQETYDVVVETSNAGNSDPVIDSTAGELATVGRAYAYQVNASDADGDTLRYFLTGDVPGGMAINNDTGLIQWTPLVTQSTDLVGGPYLLEVLVVDGHGGLANEPIALTVEALDISGNTAPDITSPPIKLVVGGEAYRYDVIASDIDGDTLTYALVDAPEGMAIHPTRGEIVWQTDGDDVGEHLVAVRVTDGPGLSRLQQFTLRVVSDNLAPEFESRPSGPARVGDQNPSTGPIDPYKYQVVAQDANGDTVTYKLLDGPVGMVLDDGLLTWTPTAAGEYWVRILAEDGRGGEAEQAFYLPVVPSNAGPTLDFSEIPLVFLNEFWAVQVFADDPDGVLTLDSFAISPSAVDAGVELLEVGGLFYLLWNPQSLGTVVMSLTVTDDAGASASADLTLPVNARPDVNAPPELDNAPLGPAVAGRLWSFVPQVSDPDGDAVVVSLDSGPTWLTEGMTPDGSFMISGIPTEGGIVSISLKLQDVNGVGSPINPEVLVDFALPVLDNAPPFILSAPIKASLAKDVAWDAVFEVIDPNNDIVLMELLGNPSATAPTFSATNGTAFASDPDNPTSVTMTFTPDTLGDQVLRLRLTDSAGNAVTHDIDVFVYDGSQANQAPSFTFTARKTIGVGQPFIAQVVATDNEGDTLIYGLLDESGNSVTELTANPAGGRNSPVGMRIDPATGLISWTPGQADVTADPADPYAYVVTVDDGTTRVDSTNDIATLGVYYQSTNARPVIDQTSIEFARVGEDPVELIYQATATDPDDDRLTWEILDGPSTVAIDEDSGKVTWQPTGKEGNLTETLVISVKDPYGAFDTQRIDLVSTLTLRHAPRIVSTPSGFAQAGAGKQWVYVIEAEDLDNQALTFALEGALAGLSTNVVTLDKVVGSDTIAVLTWYDPGEPSGPQFDGNDELSFTVVVTDPDGLTDRQTITLKRDTTTVSETVEINSVPTYSVLGGAAYRYQVQATGSTGGYTYSLTAIDVTDTDSANHIDLTTELSGIIDSNGLINWAGIGTDATDDYIDRQIQFSVTATGAQGAKAFQSFVVGVGNPAGNSVPVIQPISGLTTSDDSLVFDVIASDSDGDQLTFKLFDTASQLLIDAIPANGPLGAVQIDSQGRVTWTPAVGELTRTVSVRVLDAHGAFDTEDFVLAVVSPTDHAPVVSLRVEDTSAVPGQVLIFNVQAEDDKQLVDVFVELTNTQLFGSTGLKIPVGVDGVARYVLDNDAALSGQTIIASATARDDANQAQTTAGVPITIQNPDTSGPVVRIDALPGTTIDAITDILGKVSDVGGLTSLVVTLIPTGDLAQASPIELFRDDDGSADNIGLSTPETIATLNPLVVADGTYTFRVEASDGSSVTTANLPVVIATQGVKLGNLALGFDDMVAPVAGIPITVSRSYDSMTSGTLGDFGYGWSMDLLKGELDLDIELAQGDIRRGSGYARSALRSGSRVGLTLPGGEKMNFTVVPQAYIPTEGSHPAAAALFGQTGSLTVAFLPDTPNSLGAKLEFAGGEGTLQAKLVGPEDYGFDPLYNVNITTAQVLLDSRTGEFRQFLMGASNDVSPPLDLVEQKIDLQLTTRDNSVYLFDSLTGELKSVTDAYGNVLKLEGDDIVSRDSAGETGRLDIQRDGMNRVTRVTNALGFRVQYEYDTVTGDLIKVRQDIDQPLSENDNTNRQRITILKYDTDAQFNGTAGQAHYLRQIMLDDGTILSDIDFENGLVKSTGTPTGPQQSVVYDSANNQQTTTTSFGDSGADLVDQAIYDAHGNVTQMTRGAVEWNYTFDDDRFPDRMTSQTDPYNRVTTFEYDRLGQLIKSTSHDDVVTTYGYNEIGQLIRVTNQETGRSEYRDYNYAGDLLKVYDDAGHVFFENVYNDQGRLLSETDESGTTTYVYDALGRYPIATILPDGEQIGSEYDALGQLDVFISDGERSAIDLDGFGRTSRATYDTEEANGDALVVDYTYDADPTTASDDGLAADWTTIDSPTTGTITRKLSPTGQLEGWISEDGTETTYTYDNGRLFRETVTIPDGSGGVVELSKTKYQYNAQGQVERVTDEITGVYTQSFYDLLGRVITSTVTDPIASTTYATITDHEETPGTYAPGPNSVSDTLGAKISFNYFLPTDVNKPMGTGKDHSVTQQTQRLRTDPNNPGQYITRTSYIEYNAAGLPVAIVNADGSRRLIEYRNTDVIGDAEQSPTRVTDEAGRDRHYTYLPDGRLASATDLADNTLYLGYDNDDRLQTVDLPIVAGPGGDELYVIYDYDDQDRVDTIARPGLGTTTIHRFSIAGDPELIELPNGDFARHTYNLGDNATPNLNTGILLKQEVITGAQLTTNPAGDTIIDPANPGTAVESFTYAYAPHGGIASITNDLDQSATTYSYEYQRPLSELRDITTRLARIDLPNGTAVEYRYDALGRVTQLTSFASPTDTTGFATEYAYDTAGRLKQVTDPSAGITTYTYDLAGRLSTRLLPNGIQTTWTFDTRDRIVSLEHLDTGSVSASPGTVESFTYWYTPDGSADPLTTSEPRRITRADGSYVEYDYDASLRLSAERYYNSAAVLTQTIQYDYDAAGNRTGRTIDGVAETYVGESSSAYKLDKVTDASGTVRDYTTDSAGRVMGIDSDTLSYNAQGQLTGYNSTSYHYDAQGQRIGTTTGSTNTHYAIAPSAQNLGLDLGLRYLTTDGTSGGSTAYIYAGENPIARHTTTGTEYYLEDATDSIRALTDDTAAVSEAYDYDAFGNVLSSDQPDLGYHGAWHEDASGGGLIDMRLRSYDPQTGRFLSVDPFDPTPSIYESFNPYTFANQNPMLYSDPTGGFSVTEINVSQSVGQAQQAIRTQLVRELKDRVKDEVIGIITNQLTNVFIGFLPIDLSGFISGGNPNLTDAANQGNGFGSSFEQRLCEALDPTGIGHLLWVQPEIRANGNPVSDGYNCADLGGTPEFGNVPRPDFLFREGGPKTQRHNGNRAYLIGEIKLDTKTFYNAYVKKQSNQFSAIARYATDHAYGVALFVTLKSSKDNVDKALERKGQRLGFDRGLFIQLVSILPSSGKKR